MTKWYKSRTLWVNLLALIGIMAQAYTGREVIPSEMQASLLGIINLALRAITKDQIEW